MKSFTQDMTLSPESLAEARAWVVGHVRECAVGHQVDLLSAEIAVGEILQNIIRYAYGGDGPITLRVSDLDEAVGVSVIDSARPSDPSDWVSDKAASSGGMGLSIIKNAVDAVSFRPLDEGNKVSVYFFPSHRHLDPRSLLWMGELLDARLFKDSFERWALWTTPEPDPWFSELLKRSIDLVEQHEKRAVHTPEYHNLDHFRDVLVTVAHQIQNEALPLLSRPEKYALVLAAILHDYAHPGGVAACPGEFEEKTLALISEASLAIGLDPAARDILRQAFVLIESTSPTFSLADSSRLELLFNEADVAPSLIPWFGLQQAKALQDELGDKSHTLDFYNRFRSSQRVGSVATTPWLNLYS